MLDPSSSHTLSCVLVLTQLFKHICVTVLLLIFFSNKNMPRDNMVVNICMNKEFSKLHLLYKIIMHIADTRQKILAELISYVDDPVRYKRRMRFLIQLAKYEHQLLVKIDALIDFDISYYNEEMLKQLKDEVSLITDSSS